MGFIQSLDFPTLLLLLGKEYTYLEGIKEVSCLMMFKFLTH
uniref:Uncharacterized protein n=1 Tax=Picea sitchensis TaxID=3332 RepID=A9NR81_PICSI|nr:unknown [Picea sitchensis]